MVADEEIVVPLERTDDNNAADFLTKPMLPDKFVKSRDFITTCMNIKSPLSASAKTFVPSEMSSRA